MMRHDLRSRVREGIGQFIIIVIGVLVALAVAGILSEPDGNYRKLVFRMFSGPMYYDWRINGHQPDQNALVSALSEMYAPEVFEEEINSELWYTTGLAYYLQQHEALARQLLVNMNQYYPVR